MNRNFLRATLSLLIFFSMVSCEKKSVNEPVVNGPKQTENAEMRRAAEVVVKMVGENAEYFSYIDAAVRDGSLEYMDDRVLFKDLFTTGVKTKGDGGLSFANDFARLAESDGALTKSAGEVTDADRLMAYLEANNISIYCPFPLEDYDEDNRIPAITTVVYDGEGTQPGIQYHADGTYEEVMVNQEYADKNPVWIVRQENDYIFDAANARQTRANNRAEAQMNRNITSSPYLEGLTIPKIIHYEMSIGQIYCQEYMGNLFEGDLDIRLCFCNLNPKYSQADECFKGEFDYIIPVQMERKYVGWAKKGWDAGWFDVNCVFDTDWKPTEHQQYFAAYDYDWKYGINASATLKGTYKGPGAEAGAEAKIGLEYKSSDDLMGLMQWDRVWMFDKVLKNGGATWKNDSGTNRNTAPDGNYLVKPSSYFWLSIKRSIYYSDATFPVNPGTGGGIAIVNPIN